MSNNIQIENISINNFKCFKEFSINNLKRFNLIFGKNSVGKSSLLEALFLYSNMFFSDNFLSTFLYRALKVTNNLEIVFNNFNYKDSIKIKTDKKELIINPIPSLKDNSLDGIYYDVLNEQNKHIKIPLLNNIERKLDSSFESINNSFQYKGKQFDSSRINMKLFNNFYINNGVHSDQEGHESIVNLFNRLQNTKKDEIVVNALKNIIPEIKSLRISTDKICEADIGLDRYIPINNLGEGVLKIFDYIVFASNISNGVLMIDEIDNGFHYSSLTQLWNVLFELCDKNNIQLFATTHSYECIKAFKNESKEKDILGIRIENSNMQNGIYKAITYDYDELDNAIDNWEVR